MGQPKLGELMSDFANLLGGTRQSKLIDNTWDFFEINQSELRLVKPANPANMTWIDMVLCSGTEVSVCRVLRGNIGLTLDELGDLQGKC